MSKHKPAWFEKLSKGPFANKTVTSRLMDETERAMRKRLTRRTARTFRLIAVAGVITSVAAVFVVSGIGWDDFTTQWKRSEPTVIPAPVHSPQPTEPPDLQDGAITVQNEREVGAGPISNMYTTIGGIRLGDSQEQVLFLLGEPGERKQAHDTNYPLWVYPDKHLSIMFYPGEENKPPGGVVSVRIQDKSRLKLTDRRVNTDVRLGDSSARLLELYRPISVSAASTVSQNIWIRGRERGKDGLYKPVVHILMKEGRLISIELHNDGENPTPDGSGQSNLGDANIRASGVSRYGELTVVSGGSEKMEPLGAPSCIGRETDLKFEGSYKTVFKRKNGTETVVSSNPISAIVFPSAYKIPIPKLDFDTFEAFYFAPAYADCFGLEFHLYGITDNSAFEFRFEWENNHTNSFHFLPSTKPFVENGHLVVYGGFGAGSDFYTKHYFKPDIQNRIMVLVKTETTKERPALE